MLLVFSCVLQHNDIARTSVINRSGISILDPFPFLHALLTRISFLPMCKNQGKAANDKVQGPGKGLHILVAEDNIVNQRVAVTLLQKWGHTTVLACNGAEAVEKSAKENFDLILMDVCTSLNYLYSESAKSAYIFVKISCL
jgi:hypothetical protein